MASQTPMSSPAPTPASPRRPFDASAWRPSRRALWWVLGAFALGLVAFAMVIRDRGDPEFFRAADEEGRQYAPLPAPLPAGQGSGIERVEAPVEQSQAAVVEEPQEVAPPPPPPPPPRPVERPRPAETVAREARPLPGQTPPPDYPRRALARREGGTALVIVHIGPDGVPTSTDLAQSSGSRDLDRAAQQAVRRWRFEPKLENGVPVVSRAVVPIDFRPEP